MEPNAQSETAASQADNGNPTNGTAGRIAADLAEKHGAASTDAGPVRSEAPKNKGGRRTAQEEAEKWLAENGLRAVPNDAQGNPADNPPVGAAGSCYAVPPDFAKDCALTLLTAVKESRVKNVYLRTMAIGKDKGLAEDMARAAVPPAGTIETMGLAVEQLAIKYQIMGQWSPEVMFGISALMWLNSDLKLNKRLSELEKQFKTTPPA